MTAHGVDRSGAAGGAGGVLNPVDEQIIDAKGDLFVGDAADSVTRLAVGADDRMLMADSAKTTGIKWATPDQVLQAAINGATAETAPAVGDLVGISDVSATAGRKMTLENTLKVINGLTADATPDGAADYVPTYDASAGSAKKVLLTDAVNGAYRSVQVFTGSGTWTKPAGLKRVKVTVVGGGGGSGGTAATGVSESAAASGGGGGGTAIKTIATASLGATETVTIGAGGTAGAAGNNNGAAGGTSSFGAHCSATGGGFGSGGGNFATTGTGSGQGGDGGIGSSGDINIKGSGGGTSLIFGADGDDSVSGCGGDSVLGGGARALRDGTAGQAGGNFGGGASGAASAASAAARAGAAGAGGIVIVEEFF